jgi:hypothetical protein
MQTMADSAVLVETTILVDYLRGSRATADYLDAARSEGELYSSAVTKAELIVGSWTRAESRAIDQLFDAIRRQHAAPPRWSARPLPPSPSPLRAASATTSLIK